MYYFSRLLGYKSSIIHHSVDTDGQQLATVQQPASENSILNLFKRYIPQRDEFFASANPNSLQWMKKVLLKSGLNEDHSYITAIDLTLLKIQKSAGPLVYFRVPITEPMYLAPFHLSSIGETSAAKFEQSLWMNVEETKKLLANLNEPIEEIELHDVNDDLLAFIVEKFPKLTVLRIREGIGAAYGPWMDFTDKGLLSMGNLLSLQKFELSAWDNLVSISPAGLKNLLSQPVFAKQLTELKLKTFHAVDENIAPVATYRQLKTLLIHSAFITHRGLTQVLQSPLLKSSLSHLHLYNSMGFDSSISDDVLEELENYPDLEHLLIAAAPWHAAGPSVQKLLAAKSTLKTLVLNGITISDDIAKEIGKMNELEHLELFNCADVTAEDGLPQLLKSKDKLRHLNLQRISHLRNEQFPLIGELNALESLSLSSPILGYVSGDGLKLLCECENMQKNLHTLQLKEFSDIKSDGFIYLSELNELFNLRVDGCPWFNDFSLESLGKSPVKETLQKMELNKTTISDEAIFTLMKFENLRNLTLASCYSLTERGKRLFFSDPFLQTQLIGLCMDNFDLSDELVKDLDNFEVLKVLVMSNNTLSDEGRQNIFDLAKEKKWLMNLSWGETGYFTVFEQLLQEVQVEPAIL
jgi:hypothetical protein